MELGKTLKIEQVTDTDEITRVAEVAPQVTVQNDELVTA